MTSALEVLTNGLPECASAWPSVSIAVRSRRIMSSGSAKSPPKAMCRTPSAVSAPPRSLSRSVKRGPGPSIERARAIGHLAMTAARDLDHDAAMHLWRSVLPLSVWPKGDLRITSVRCETGETVLWTRSDGIDLPTAVASSCAVPGFLPPVPFGGAHYCDAPRLPSAAALAKEKNLDAIIFIGPRAGALANVAEDAELDELERQGLRVVRITDGPDFTDVAGELLDQRLRPRAAQIGLDDGRRAAQQVAALR
ncbi:hypothetical protein AB0B92_25640 [Streptomyces hygroscopicus]|uniref:hypothetical protein n=1 Tax=Streptomyces TaxID=1883 RepID=UPI0020A223AD|nr:hypothetical protein [Streptomyces sp. RKCA744]MCO8303962.1 hypothetical protein [Streptomyces sp. RKCA744]